jgi:threonine dehydrogenase-like Zn-dependent dehydrogenase
MRGIVLTGEKEVAIKQFPDPLPGPGEVVVRVKAAAICGSDLPAYHAPKEHAAKRGDLIQGHEPSGVVELIGAGVTAVQPGDRVTVYHYLGCGHCEQCAAGNLMWCREARGLGSRAHGGDADLLLIDERNALKLPDELTFIDGAAIACVAGTGFSALSKIAPSGRDTLAVFGLGPVGLTGVMFGKAMGARVIGVGRRQIRLDLAKKLGADEVIDIDETPEPGKALMELTGGRGVDAAYETSGSQDAYMAMLQGLRRGGRAVMVAGSRFERPFGLGGIVGKQLTIMGSFVMPIHMYGDLTKFMLAHDLHFEPMVTHKFKLEDAAQAFELFDSGECGKVVFAAD